MRGLGHDLRLSLRALAARPGTSLLALAALALGIGLTTTMFSIVQGAFLRGLPFEHSERIMYVGRTDLTQPGQPNGTSVDDFVDWRRDQRAFEELAAFSTAQAVVASGSSSQRYRMARITPNVLHLLRVTPPMGRDLTEADAAHGAPAVAIISYPVWKNQFDGTSKVLGTVVRVNGTPTEIVGVMPERFGFPQTQDLWVPLEVAPGVKRGGTFVEVVGRLRADATLAQANAELGRIAQGLARQYPENKNVGAAAIPFVRRFIGTQVINTLNAMLGAVFGVLLIACANVMSLQLARAADRSRDIAVRTALGASRARIIRQLLVEGLMLSAAGAALGLVLASVGTVLFTRAVADSNPPFWIDIKIDGTVLLFVTGLTVLAAIASSLVPALRATRQNPNTVLKDEGRANTGLRMGRITRSLVIGEVLVSCVLLVVSGLMIKGVAKLATIQYPFATADVLTAGLGYDEQKYSKDEDQAALAARVEDRLVRVPGVTHAALSNGVPTPGGGTPFSIAGAVYQTDAEHPKARLLSATASYFDVLRVKALKGRIFGPGDTIGAERVAIVDEGFARKFFPGDEVLGKRIQLGLQTTSPWLTIVGVVPTLAVAATPGDVTEFVYRPVSQSPRGLNLLLSTAGDPKTFIEPVRRAIQDVDPDLAVFNADSLAGSLDQRAWAFRVFGTLFMSFGVAALILAAAGLYGVMAFSVRMRTQEIGIRMALGADRQRVMRSMLWQGMWRALLGIALGVLPAWKLGTLMTVLLYQVKPTDPLVFGVTIAVLVSAAAVASVVPAYRAATVDPLKALRHG